MAPRSDAKKEKKQQQQKGAKPRQAAGALPFALTSLFGRKKEPATDRQQRLQGILRRLEEVQDLLAKAERAHDGLQRAAAARRQRLQDVRQTVASVTAARKPSVATNSSKGSRASAAVTVATAVAKPSSSHNSSGRWVAISIGGLGTETAPTEELEAKAYELSYFTGLPRNDARYIFDKKRRGIWKMWTLCKLTPSLTAKFVQETADQVERLLVDGRSVLLLGHSYGGSVATRVATLLDDAKQGGLSDDQAARLHVATFGSIYVQPKPLARVRLMHHLRLNDVASECNGLKDPKAGPGVDAKRGIVWLPAVHKETTFLAVNKLNPKSPEWQNHMSYGAEQRAIMATGDVRLFAEQSSAARAARLVDQLGSAVPIGPRHPLATLGAPAPGPQGAKARQASPRPVDEAESLNTVGPLHEAHPPRRLEPSNEVETLDRIAAGVKRQQVQAVESRRTNAGRVGIGIEQLNKREKPVQASPAGKTNANRPQAEQKNAAPDDDGTMCWSDNSCYVDALLMAIMHVPDNPIWSALTQSDPDPANVKDEKGRQAVKEMQRLLGEIGFVYHHPGGIRRQTDYECSFRVRALREKLQALDKRAFSRPNDWKTDMLPVGDLLDLLRYLVDVPEDIVSVDEQGDARTHKLSVTVMPTADDQAAGVLDLKKYLPKDPTFGQTYTRVRRAGGMLVELARVRDGERTRRLDYAVQAPLQLQLADQDVAPLHLVSMVAYEPNRQHFTCYMRKGEQWHKYDDMGKPRRVTPLGSFEQLDQQVFRDAELLVYLPQWSLPHEWGHDRSEQDEEEQVARLEEFAGQWLRDAEHVKDHDADAVAPLVDRADAQRNRFRMIKHRMAHGLATDWGQWLWAELDKAGLALTAARKAMTAGLTYAVSRRLLRELDSYHLNLLNRVQMYMRGNDPSWGEWKQWEHQTRRRLDFDNLTLEDVQAIKEELEAKWQELHDKYPSYTNLRRAAGGAAAAVAARRRRPAKKVCAKK